MGEYCHNLALALGKQGREAGIEYTFLWPEADVPQLDCGVDIEKVSLRRKLFPWSCQSYDLWHSTHQDSRYWPATAGEKLVLTIHDLNFLGEKNEAKVISRIKRLQKKMDRANVITVISEYTKAQVEQHLLPHGKPIHCVYNGVAALSDQPGAIPSALPRDCVAHPFLLYLGVVRKKKNVHVLPALMAGLPQYNLVIAGGVDPEYRTQIQTEIDRYQIGARVFFLGEVNDPEKVWLYKNCEAFLFPSLLEGFGIPVIEAMQFGKPVFISNQSSLPEVAGPEAYVWESFDATAMTERFLAGMADFSSDADKKNRLKKHASRFSWEKAAREYTNIYKAVLDIKT